MAGSGDGTDRLEFQGRGVEDNLGVSLDNVILLPTSPAGIAAALEGGATTGGNDVIEGGDGDDIIYGEGGSDTITGGLGADTLFGGGDDDTILVGAGDVAFGGGGDDVVDPRARPQPEAALLRVATEHLVDP